MNTIVSAAKLAEDLVAHRWKLFETVPKKHHELPPRAKPGGQAPRAIRPRHPAAGTFLFSALVGRSWLRGQTLLARHLQPPSHRSFAFFLAYCHPNLCTQPFLCPSFGHRVGPTGDTELDRRASDKNHEEFALGLMDGPYNSLEECPGQHKVFVRRKLRWQSGDVRNIDKCSENGINETFESNETYKPAGVDHHVSAVKLWEASLPGVKLHGFVAEQIGIGLNLVVVFWCRNSGTRRFGKAPRLPFWSRRLCPRLCAPSNSNLCTFATSFARTCPALSR